jgi:Invasin, domain 3
MKLTIPSPMSRNLFLRRTPVAVAIVLMQGLALAQPAANTTSADVPEAKSLFETGGQAGIGPRPFNSFLDRLSSPVEKIRINVAADNLPADGVSGTEVKVQLLDAKGQVLKGDQEVTIEVNGGARILLPNRLTSESGADRGDVDRISPGVQTKTTDGTVSFKLIAPYQPEEITVRVSVRGVAERALVRYVPDLREMIAVGLIEGRLRSDKFDPKAIVPVRENDGFDNELRGFTKEFNGGRTNAGIRAAMYLKGKIQGKYLLTMAYDSDKDTRPQLFDAIDPNAFYPVYGDSSIRGVDAQSTGKLYVRLDKDRSFLMYGDYTTNDNNPARTLGQYNRSLPGLRGHLEEGNVVANAFVAQQSFRQVVDEFPARGVSGPYSVSNPNGIKGSEKIEIVVRSRNQTAVILKTTALTRSADYEFEPFNGQILFRAPVPSFDDQLNPVSIRITYEVEQGGERFTVYGGDVKLKLSEGISIGASAAKDNNPAAPQTVVGANLHLKLSQNTELIGEIAKSSSVVNTGVNGFNTNNSANFAGKSGTLDGSAKRIEIRHADEAWRANAYAMRADNDFNNASSGVTGGKQEVGGTVNYKAGNNLTLTAELKRSEDRILASKNEAATVAGDLKLSERLTVGAGVRRVQQNSESLSQQTNSNCLSTGALVYSGAVTGYNTGYGISQVGNQQIDPATGLPVVCNTAINPAATPVADLDRKAIFGRIGFKPTSALSLEAEVQHITGTDPGNTLKLGAKYAATERLNFTGEVQREVGGDKSNNLYRLGADWRVADKTRIYSRYEYDHQYSGTYGLGAGPLTRAFALGIDTQYMQDGTLYNEYRLTDSSAGKSIQNAIGLRNGWNVAQGLKLLTNVERLNSTAGNSTAAGVGAEYTASELWKGSGRIEWREDNANTNWLLTAGLARKLDRDWTFIGRDYFNRINPLSGAADTRQNRLQLGFAYRPVDNNQFDALGLYERKNENTADKQNTTNIVSLRGNYHPSRPWFVSGRLASKQVNELLAGNVNDSYRASLIGGRVTYDITNRWSVGGITTLLVGSGGTKQYAYGAEVGYTLMDNLLVTLGYNWRGFRDDDLTGSDYTNRGWVLGMRYKFDEDLFKRDDARVNRALSPTATPAIGTGAAPAKP